LRYPRIKPKEYRKDSPRQERDANLLGKGEREMPSEETSFSQGTLQKRQNFLMNQTFWAGRLYLLVESRGVCAMQIWVKHETRMLGWNPPVLLFGRLMMGRAFVSHIGIA